MRKLTIFSIIAMLALALSAVAIAGDGHDCSKHKDTKAPESFDSEQKVGTKATCPVMGGEFTIDETTPHSEFKGKHIYFCCAGCKPKFDAEPEKYTKEK